MSDYKYLERPLPKHIVKQIRADAIDECKKILKDYESTIVGNYYFHLLLDMMEELKEQKND